MLAEFDFAMTQLCDMAGRECDLSTLMELSPAQTHIIEAASFGPQSPLPYELLHHAFEDRALRDCDLSAIEFEGVGVSYGALNGEANDLAYSLRKNGVRYGCRVAVIMDRCLEFPLSLLAVLKTGASYIPIDATFPAKRIAFMLANANVFAIICTAKFTRKVTILAGTLKNDRRANICTVIPAVYNNSYQRTNSADFIPDIPSHRTSEAYVVYTSGSTGTPKGVPVLHAGAVSLTSYLFEPLAYKVGMRVMQNLAIGFDWCQEEIWKTLSHGATLVLRGDNVLATLEHVDVLACTPTALSQFGHPSLYPNLKFIEIGGEAAPPSLVNLWAPYVQLINTYGPSECASTTNSVRLLTNSSINIGKPHYNVHTHILDSKNSICPIGVGEIYLSGLCVSPGYINLPEQTDERFILDPFIGGEQRMFRTGDLGRLLPNGNFEVLGRQDSQVKLKGYRIELDEVAGAMMQHPQVVTAAAIVKDKTHLVGYFTPANVSSEELQDLVSSLLPVYMAPAVWVGLDVMPQNSNGKIDRNILSSMHVENVVEIVQTESEAEMANIWAELLNIPVETLGRRTSFFSVGGDSFTAVKLIASIHKGFKVSHLTLNTIIKAPLLKDLTAIATKPQTQEQELKPIDSNKFKIVCFHGKGSNPAHLNFQASPLVDYMGDGFEWEFLEAPHKLPIQELETLPHYYDGMDGYSWLSEDEDPTDITIAYLKTKMASMGRIDVLFGFCLGANVVRWLDMWVAEGHIEKTWAVSVLVAPTSFEDGHPGADIPSLAGPCVHVSAEDEFISMSHIYSDLVEIQHTSGHNIPRKLEFVS
ncbi:hypothetical protein As57867_006329, partial [Aphanomyces stellatus]